MTADQRRFSAYTPATVRLTTNRSAPASLHADPMDDLPDFLRKYCTADDADRQRTKAQDAERAEAASRPSPIRCPDCGGRTARVGIRCAPCVGRHGAAASAAARKAKKDAKGTTRGAA